MNDCMNIYVGYCNKKNKYRYKKSGKNSTFSVKIFLKNNAKYIGYDEDGAFLMSWGWCWASRSFSPRLCCPEKSSSSDDPNYRKKCSDY